MATMDARMKDIQKKRSETVPGILSEVRNPIEQLLLSEGPKTQGHFGMAASEPFQLIEYFEREAQQLDEDLEKLNREITELIFHSHRLGTMPYERIKRDYGTEIADIVSEFTYCDPYEMCFALLYLMDSDSDLPWLYYPGIVLRENAGAMLPWFGEEYDELEDAHWDEYFGAEPRKKREAVKNVPELADWYRLDYIFHNSDLDFQYRNNLAQIVYEVTGSIPPRDLHRYDDGIKHLRRYGITGKRCRFRFCIA